MMGHRDTLKTGDEYDLVGRPGHRWRDVMSKNAGRWSYVKNKINRRSRR